MTTAAPSATVAVLFSPIVVAIMGAVVITGELDASSAAVVPAGSTAVDSPASLEVALAATLELASSSARELTVSAPELTSAEAWLVAEACAVAASRTVVVEV